MQSLKLTFRKHPNSLKLPDETLAARNAAVRPEDGAVVLFEGAALSHLYVHVARVHL